MGTRISGVILAGGASKRFGGVTKSNVTIQGVTIISRIINTIRGLFGEIIIVTNTPAEFSELAHYKIVTDEYLKAGPLGGIHAGLKSSFEEAIFVFAGDMPFLDKKIIKDMIYEFGRNDHDVLIPKVGKYIEPLHAIYKKSILNDLEEFLSESKSKAVRDFISKLNVGYLKLPETEKNRLAFLNINSPSDMTGLIQ